MCTVLTLLASGLIVYTCRHWLRIQCAHATITVCCMLQKGAAHSHACAPKGSEGGALCGKASTVLHQMHALCIYTAAVFV